MQVDDEVVFGRALDESRAGFEQIESLRRALMQSDPVAVNPHLCADLTLATALFELHGATLRCLATWYPSEDRVRLAALEWERSSSELARAAPA